MASVTITSVPGSAYKHELKARTHTIVSDVPTSLKGGDSGPTPHELLHFALGACTAMTLEMYAAQKRWPLTSVTVTVSETTVSDPESPGKNMPRITEQIELEGTLTEDQLKALRTIAEKCPVYKLVTGRKEVVTELSLKGA